MTHDSSYAHYCSNNIDVCYPIGNNNNNNNCAPSSNSESRNDT